MFISESFFKKATTGEDIPTDVFNDFAPEDVYQLQNKTIFVDDVMLNTNEVFLLNNLAQSIFSDERRWIDLYIVNGVKQPGTHFFGEILVF